MRTEKNRWYTEYFNMNTSNMILVQHYDIHRHVAEDKRVHKSSAYVILLNIKIHYHPHGMDLNFGK